MRPYPMLLCIVLLSLAVIFCWRHLQTFLSESDERSGDILVIDAWLPTYDLQLAAAEYRSFPYKHVLAATGVYALDSTESGRSRAKYAASILARSGIPKSRLKMVLFPGVERNRTFQSALAVKSWLEGNHFSSASLRLLTSSAHVRRSRNLYQLVFGKAYSISVGGLEDPSYDPNKWWASSEGLREVLSEFAAYLYVKSVFIPRHAAFLAIPGIPNFPAFPALHFSTTSSPQL